MVRFFFILKLLYIGKLSSEDACTNFFTDFVLHNDVKVFYKAVKAQMRERGQTLAQQFVQI